MVTVTGTLFAIHCITATCHLQVTASCSQGASSLEIKLENALANTAFLPCTEVEFKLAVFTIPVYALACALICDHCQPTKIQEAPQGIHIYR